MTQIILFFCVAVGTVTVWALLFKLYPATASAIAIVFMLYVMARTSYADWINRQIESEPKWWPVEYDKVDRSYRNRPWSPV